MDGKKIDGASLTLDKFLEFLLSPTKRAKLYPNNCFPTDELFENFLATLDKRSDHEIKMVLECLLVSESSYGHDRLILQLMLNNQESRDRFKERYPLYLQRLVSKKYAWEGITWILDLLPESPKEALQVIDAFFYAYCQILPDNVLSGLSDANEIIRAKFINRGNTSEILHDMSPKDYECLIAELFSAKGYETELTKDSHDGGVDVIARLEKSSQKETILIQCKRHLQNISVKEVRELLGVVEHRRATRGIVCASSGFTASALVFAKRSQRIELLGGPELMNLLNEELGPRWPSRIGRYEYSHRERQRKGESVPTSSLS
jgi:restriction system protein